MEKPRSIRTDVNQVLQGSYGSKKLTTGNGHIDMVVWLFTPLIN